MKVTSSNSSVDVFNQSGLGGGFFSGLCFGLGGLYLFKQGSDVLIFRLVSTDQVEGLLIVPSLEGSLDILNQGSLGGGSFYIGLCLLEQGGDLIIAFKLGEFNKLDYLFIIGFVKGKMNPCLFHELLHLRSGLLHFSQRINHGLPVPVFIGGLRGRELFRGTAGEQKQGQNQADRKKQSFFQALHKSGSFLIFVYHI